MTVGGGDSDDVDDVLGKCERDSSKFAEAGGGLSVDEPGKVQLAIERAAAAAGLCSDRIHQQGPLLQGHAGMLERMIGWDSQSPRSLTILFWTKTAWTQTRTPRCGGGIRAESWARQGRRFLWESAGKIGRRSLRCSLLLLRVEDEAVGICSRRGKEGGPGRRLGTPLGRQKRAGDVFGQHHSRRHRIGRENSRGPIGHRGDPGSSDPVPASDPPVQWGGVSVWRGGGVLDWLLVTAMVILGRRIAGGAPRHPQRGTAPTLTPGALVSERHRSGEGESPLRGSRVVPSYNLSLLLVVVGTILTAALLVIMMVVAILMIIIVL